MRILKAHHYFESRDDDGRCIPCQKALITGNPRYHLDCNNDLDDRCDCICPLPPGLLRYT